LALRQPNVEEIFLECAPKDPADRQAHLEETRADSSVRRTRVEALLKAHDSAGTFLECPAVQPAINLSSQEPPAAGSDPPVTSETLSFLDRCDTPGRLGLLAHYEILEILGSGGMGVVLRGLDVIRRALQGAAGRPFEKLQPQGGMMVDRQSEVRSMVTVRAEFSYSHRRRHFGAAARRG
jgi:hypothetical protein